MAITDKFANLANIEINESAANTLTFQEITSGAGIFEKMAMVIHRIEYVTTGVVLALLVANADTMSAALVTSNQITGISKDKAQVIDRLRLTFALRGVAAEGTIFALPWVHDFSSLPGGGLIVPATNLYIAAEGTSLTAATFWRMSIYFTYRELKGEEYWELVEATRALS